MLDITNTAVVDILVRLTVVGSEGVIDVTSGFTAVFQVAELVDLESVKAGFEALKFSNDRGEIVRLLHELEGAAGVGVSEEVELARGANGLVLLGSTLPVVIDGLSVVCLDITGADSAATNPWEAIGAAVVGAVTGGRAVVIVAIAITVGGTVARIVVIIAIARIMMVVAIAVASNVLE